VHVSKKKIIPLKGSRLFVKYCKRILGCLNFILLKHEFNTNLHIPSEYKVLSKGEGYFKDVIVNFLMTNTDVQRPRIENNIQPEVVLG
jgi:hypothetical protein